MSMPADQLAVSPAYHPRRVARSRFAKVRTLDVHVHEWGDPSLVTPERPPVVMVHGWMDVGASFQFVVDALQQDRYVIAPDWRGFGQTSTPQADHYVFADYLADLDMLLDHYAPGQAVDLVGHSMGGNVAMFYAGARPARVRRLVNLEGFGMPASKPAKAPQRYAEWMDELKALQRGEMALKTYDSADGVARRLMKTNPRLPQDKAQWLARHWARPNAQGQWEILGDAAHKVTNATLFRLEEALALYAAITAPTLSIEASDDSLGMWWKDRYTLAEYHERIGQIADCRTAVARDAGHMLHHDQPAELAELLENFWSAGAG